MTSKLLSFLILSLYIVWIIDWLLVAYYYGKSSRRAWKADRANFSSVHINIMRLHAWALFSSFSSRFQKWSPDRVEMPRDYIVLQFGIFISALAAGLLGLNNVLVGGHLLYPTWDKFIIVFLVILSCTGAMSHLLVSMYDRLAWWRLLYLLNFLIPIGTMFYVYTNIMK